MKSDYAKKYNLERNTFCVRFQPNLDFKLSVPGGMNKEYAYEKQCCVVPPLKYRWYNGMTYGQFKQNIKDKYYI